MQLRSPHQVQQARRAIIALLLFIGYIFLSSQVLGTPSAPQLDIISNSSFAGTGSGTLVNDSAFTGGTIVTINLDAVQQNTHWKGFVGNITGAFALQDAAGFSLYEWAVAVFTGEVYATRVDNVSWTTINCSNVTHVENEMLEFDHDYADNPQDNINETFFETANHRQFSVGAIQFNADVCNYSIRTFVNNSDQASLGSSFFDEVLLYDSNTDNLVYMTLMEDSLYGYRNDSSVFDYQIMLPENGTPGAAATATPYYFYVELL